MPRTSPTSPARLGPTRRLAVVALLIAALAGCASRPSGTLQPVAAEPAVASTVEMLVATSRQADPAPGVLFNGERGRGLSLADITVSIPNQRAVGTVNWPRTVPGDPARDFVATSVEPLPTKAIGSWFGALKDRPRPVLIFVHGFNNGFDDGVYRLTQIAHDTGYSGTPVLFSWASAGKTTGYIYDKESANAARDDLEATLKMLSKTRAKSIDIIAHSMGTWVTMEALRQLAITAISSRARLKAPKPSAASAQVTGRSSKVKAMAFIFVA